MTYYYGDNLRFDLWFDNPNHAGIFLVCLIPFIWWGLKESGRINTRWIYRTVFVVGWVLHFTMLYFLAMTYSRGSFVALLIAAIYWVGQVAVSRATNHSGGSHPSAKNSFTIFIRAVIVSILFFIVMAIVTQSGYRVVQGLGGEDDSVGNRLIVWKGGLEMIAENPSGVGYGRSGDYFMQYYQPLGMQTGYKSLINTWLTGIAEWGITVSGVALFFVIFIFCLSREGMIRKGQGTLGVITLGSSLIGFLAGTFFSNITPIWSLWILPLVCLMILGVNAFMYVRTQGKGVSLKPFYTGMVITISLIFLVVSTGIWLGNDNPLSIKESPDGQIIRICPKDTSNPSKKWLVFIDSRVWGSHYGHAMRELAELHHLELLICTDKKLGKFEGLDRVIISGGHIDQLPAILESYQAADYLVIIPSLAPPPSAVEHPRFQKVKVILPGMDPLLCQEWQSKVSGPDQLLILPGIEQNIMWAWQEVKDSLK